MILFAPHDGTAPSDAATEANLAVAETMATGLPDRRLLGADATRERLLSARETTGDDLFALTHGRHDSLMGAQGGVALTKADVPRVGSRAVFAYACHTGTRFGAAFAQGGARWWGDTGAVSAPCGHRAVRRVFGGLLDRLAVRVTAVAAVANLIEAVEALHADCEAAASTLDAVFADDPDARPLDAYLALLHLWQRLRVWFPGATVPWKHPAAPPPLFLR
jgi:hypothetical protein